MAGSVQGDLTEVRTPSLKCPSHDSCQQGNKASVLILVFVTRKTWFRQGTRKSRLVATGVQDAGPPVYPLSVLDRLPGAATKDTVLTRANRHTPD